jgi:ABC-2 type transport system permease protein
MSGLAGTGGLIRLIVRRDRWVLALWLLVILVIVVGPAASIGEIYPTAAARQARFDQIMNVPAFMLFQSRVFDTSPGALVVQQAFGGGTLCAALGAVVFVVRHTRTEEQAGRRELLGATAVGRNAPLAAVLVVMFGAGGALAVLGAVGLTSNGLPADGSVAFGLVIGSAVWLAAAATAVVAQVTENSRVASIGTFALFYGFHMVRGLSAMGGDALAWLAWLVPSGWLEQVRPFAGDRWWIFGLLIGLMLVLLWVALALSARRDLASGLLPARLGPAVAAAGLRTPLALAWRMHRGLLWTAVAAAAVMSLATGLTGGGDVMQEYAQGAWVQDYAARMGLDSPSDALFVYVVFVFVFPIAMYGIMATLRLRAEETRGGAEAVLAVPVSRLQWAVSHLVFAMAVPAGLLLIIGLGFGLGLGAATGDVSGQLTHMLSITVPLIPAVWVIVGITMAAYGLFGPTWGLAGWVVLAVGILGEILVKMGMPEWLFLATSPFAHVNPYWQPTTVTVLVLTLIAGALTVIGLAGLRRRDLVA